MEMNQSWVVQITLANGGVINNIVEPNQYYDKEEMVAAYKEKLNNGGAFSDFDLKLINLNHIVHIDILNYEDVEFYEDDAPIGFDKK